MFHTACQLGKLQVAFCLLELGADVNAITPNGTTGLHFLCLLGKEECSPGAVYVQLLAELAKKGAQVTQSNTSGETALHMAVSRKNELAVKFLVESQCDVNAATKQGDTALHYAAQQGNASIVQMLLENGAQDRQNAQHLTAHDAALKAKHAEIAEAIAVATATRPKARTVDASSASAASSSVASQSTPSLSSSSASSQGQNSNASQASGSGAASSAGGEFLSPRKEISEEILTWLRPEEDPFADEDEPVVVSSQSLGLEVVGCWEVYRNEFYGKRHHVYHTTHESGAQERALCIVLARPSAEGLYKGLVVCSGEWNVFTFNAEQLLLYSTSSSDEGEQVRLVLPTLKPTKLWPNITWRLFHAATSVTNGTSLLALEAKLGMRPRLCVGVILGLEGQTKEADMFENREMVPEFEAFLDMLGERFEVPSWRAWRGTFSSGEVQTAYYASWRGFEFVFHVSTLMDAAKQRQHIGNDTVLIYYKMGSESPDVAFRGKVNACALVVRPSEDYGNKSLLFDAFYRKWIDGFVPRLPASALSIAQQSLIREILFTNIINCSYAAVKSGPYRTNRVRLFDQSISEMIAMEEEHAHPTPTPAPVTPREEKRGLPWRVMGTSAANVIPSSESKSSSSSSSNTSSNNSSSAAAAAAAVPPAPQLEDLKSGWLMKRKMKVKGKASGWKKRWCVIRDDGLSYYEHEGEEKLGCIAFNIIQTVDLLEKNLMGVSCALSEKYEFQCSDTGDIKDWAVLLSTKAMVEMQDHTRKSVSNSPPPPGRPSARKPAQPDIDDEALAELVQTAMLVVSKTGLSKKDIFRNMEDLSEVDALMASWKKGQKTDIAAMEAEPVEVLAGAIRKYFRESSPASLLSVDQLEKLIQASKKLTAPAEQIQMVGPIIGDKPLLLMLFDLLSKVDENSSVNRMNAGSLAAVFAPTFLRVYESKTPVLLLEGTKAVVSIVQFIITHFHCCKLASGTEYGWSHRSASQGTTPIPLKAEIVHADDDSDDDDDRTVSIDVAAPSPPPKTEIVVDFDLEEIDRVARQPTIRSVQQSAPPVSPVRAAPKKKAPVPPSYKAPAPVPRPRKAAAAVEEETPAKVAPSPPPTPTSQQQQSSPPPQPTTPESPLVPPLEEEESPPMHRSPHLLKRSGTIVKPKPTPKEEPKEIEEQRNDVDDDEDVTGTMLVPPLDDVFE